MSHRSTKNFKQLKNALVIQECFLHAAMMTTLWPPIPTFSYSHSPWHPPIPTAPIPTSPPTFALLPSLLALRRCLPAWSQWLWRLHVLQMGTRPRAKREWPLPDSCVQCTHRLHMMLDTCVHKYIIPPIKVQWNRYIILFLKWEYQDMSVPLESVVLTTSWWVGANSSSCNYSCTQNNQSPGFNTDL